MKKHRVLSLLLTLALLLAALPAVFSVPAMAMSGSGTQADPYIITTAAQLGNLSGSNSSESTHYRLENDLDKPIIRTTRITGRAHGKLDGNGRTIQLSLNGANTSGGYGLFEEAGYLTISNLILTGSVTRTGTGTRVGALAGSVNNSLHVDNCLSTVNVEGHSDVGGLVGSSVNSALTVINSTVSGNVSGTSEVGGVLGSGNLTIFRVSVEGNVASTSYYAGGFVAFASSNGSSIRESQMLGNVTGQAYVGGIAGRGNGITIEDCRVTGTITGLKNSDTGGIIGTSGGVSSIERCYSSGIVTGRAGVGGIVGACTGRTTTLSNSFALGLKVERTIANGSPGRVSSGSIMILSNNRASDRMELRRNGNVIAPTSDAYGRDGATVADSVLRNNAAPYTALGWDFTNIWATSAGYPLLRKVGHIKPTSITVAPPHSIIPDTGPYNQVQLTAEVLPANAMNKGVIWSVVAGSIATVDANGLVTASWGAGTVTVRATSVDNPGVWGEATVLVQHFWLYHEVDRYGCDYLQLEAGDTATLDPVGLVPGEYITSFVPDDPGVVEVVSLDPLIIKGVSGGAVQIVAETNFGRTYLQFAYVPYLGLNYTEKVIEVGESFELGTLQSILGADVEIDDADSSPVGIVAIDPSDPYSLTITGLRPGDVTVTVYAEINGIDVKADCKITVTLDYSDVELST